VKGLAAMGFAGALAPACTTVAAEVHRRELVVAVERVAPVPAGFAADDAESIRVVTGGEALDHLDACARSEGDDLVVVLSEGGRELWRGPRAAIEAVEVRRVHADEARERAHADDAGIAALVLLGGLIVVPLTFIAVVAR